MSVATGADAVTEAKKWLGTPYQWGGGHAGPVPVGTPVDCSGLVNQVFGVSGNTLTQVTMGTPVGSIAQAAPGDLVFFGPIAPGEPHHVGIYTGAGFMIDAPTTGTVVRQESIAGFGPINAIRRLVPSDGSGGMSGGSVQYSYAQLECVWTQAGGNAQFAPMAAAIAMAESSGNPNASNSNSNGSQDRGLWQINSSNGTQSSFDIMTNARGAVAISSNGTNWRPWCTAYADGACGSKGGAYLQGGAPYLKFINPNVQPDCSAPINGTNAAANQPGTAPTADLVNVPLWMCAVSPILCVGGAVQSGVTGTIVKVIQGLISTIFNPLIQIIAGVMGVAAGGVMMVFGIMLIVKESDTYQQAQQTVQQGAGIASMFLGPEGEAVGAASMAKGSRGSSAPSQGRMELARRQRADERARLRQMSTQDLLRQESQRYGRPT